MNHTGTLATSQKRGLLGACNRAADRLSSLVGHWLLALAARVSVGAIFFLSGRTKVDGVLTVNDNAYALFREEYRVPVLPPELAAQLVAYAEHLFPILLILGLFARFSALALLGITVVIQIFIYPAAWPTHLAWAVLMLYVVGRGAGPVSLDRVIGLK
jgi:putative oxidoreductase